MSFCRFPEDFAVFRKIFLYIRLSGIRARISLTDMQRSRLVWDAPGPGRPYHRRMGEAAAPVFRAISPVQSAFCFLRRTFLHARFCLRCNWSRSAIMAMNSELVGFPLAEFTV